VLYEYDDEAGVFELRVTHDATPDLEALLASGRVRMGEGVVGRAGALRAPFQVEDLTAPAAAEVMSGPIRDVLLASGRRSVLAGPLLRESRVLGRPVSALSPPGAFPPLVVSLLQTFAAKPALAIHNARLYA